MIILAGVTLGLLFSEGGIIDRATEASFKSKLSEVEEKVILYWTNKEQEAIFNGTNPTVYEKLPIKLVGENGSTVNKSDFKSSLITEIKNVSGLDVDNVNLYEIDKEKIGTQVEHTYLIDIDSLQVYDKEGEKFRGKYFHTLKSLGIDGTGEGSGSYAKTAETSPEVNKTADGDGWLKPDLTGYDMNRTYLMYYNENDLSEILEVSVDEYISNGRKSSFEKDGKTYVLDGYNQKLYANVKVVANGLTSWWVWQPRYAYHLNGTSSNPAIDVVFIDMNNNPIGDKYSGKYTVNNDGTITITASDGDSFSTGTYIVHPGFTVANSDGSKKEYQGIWMSKYNPSSTVNANHTLDSGDCYPPDMSGFDPENTYIEIYDKQTDSFIEEIKLADVNLNTINNEKLWYDYKEKVWANIKTVANGIECWWVWQPRYAYTMDISLRETTILFVDTNNKPYDKANYGDRLPSRMETHPGFTVSNSDGSKKELKGIWMSKYNPSNEGNNNIVANSGECLEPDLSGFDERDPETNEEQNATYIVYWNQDLSKTHKVLLKDYISGEKQRTITFEGETYTFYDYKNRIWANIVTEANGIECWWVWQPRFAYNASNVFKEMDVIFVTLDNKPVDTAVYGDTLKDGMIVHPGFTLTWEEDGETKTKELKGIWMSKYNPSVKN